MKKPKRKGREICLKVTCVISYILQVFLINDYNRNKINRKVIFTDKSTLSSPWSARSLIFTSSSKHHIDSVYLRENITKAMVDSSILTKRLVRSSPFLSNMSMKTLIPCLWRASTRWLTKPKRSSSPRKLTNTRCFVRGSRRLLASIV